MSASSASRRLFVVDFGALHYSGHYFNQVFGYGAAARSLGMGSDIYLRAAAPPYVIEHLGASGLLPDVPWHNPDRTVFIDEVPRVQRGMRRLWEGLEGSQISERDIVTVTSSRAQLIYAFGLWLSLRRPAERPAVFFRFFGPDIFNFTRDEFSDSGWTYQFASRAIDGLPGGERIYFTANSIEVVHLIESLCGRAAHMLCVPKYYGESFAAQTRPAGKVTIYVHCSRGGPMPQRSVDIVKAVLARRQDVDVRLRLCKHFSPSPSSMRRLNAD